MATQTKPVSVLDAPVETTTRQPRLASKDDRISFNASWDVYDMLTQALGDNSHVLLAFDGERVELVSPHDEHEDYAELVNLIVAALADELKLPRKGAGSTRWRRPAIKRGVEADKSYYFTAEKLVAIKANRRSKNELDWPIPDLAVEMDMSPSKIDRPGIYAALGVPEVWRFDGETVRIDQLGADGAYADASESRFLPIRADDIRYLLLDVADEAEDDTDFSRRVTEWVRTVLLPRLEANGT